MPMWSRRSSTEAGLQRTYDEAYQSSLQSILKESNFDYDSSLEMWKQTLNGITAGLSGIEGTTLQKANEKSLLSSILDIERQCHDRISFLQTKLYRPEQATNPYRNAGSSSSVLLAKPPGRSDSVPRVAVGSKTLSEASLETSKPRDHHPPASRSDNAVHPMPSVKDMPYDMYRTNKRNPLAQTLHQLQIHSRSPSTDNSPTRTSSESTRALRSSPPAAASAPALHSHQHSQSHSQSHLPSHSQSHGQSHAQAAAAAPQQRSMLRTLRKNPRASKPSASSSTTSKAATLAWSSTNRSPRASQEALAEKERQNDILVRTAQQAVHARQQSRDSPRQSRENVRAPQPHDDDTRMRRSPKIDQLAQWSNFDGAFESASSDMAAALAATEAELDREPSQPRAPSPRRAAKLAAAAAPRPTTRYVVTRSAAAKPAPKLAPARGGERSRSRPGTSGPSGSSGKSKPARSGSASPDPSDEQEELDEWDIMAREKIKQLRGVDENSALQILSEVVLKGDPVHWEDIAGLEKAKASLKETVVYPFLRPDLFSGLREPALGMLLFGPPGTGKTMLARAVATESKSTFFSISASSLTSKYMGESEKLVRALFQMAKALAPSIIFVDEIDSILTQRADSGEHEASRRIKNEFLVQWSDLQAAAAGKNSADSNVRRVLVLGATNLPWAIDEAARRRFVRRQYIPLPELETRRVHLEKLLSHQKHALTPEDITTLVDRTDGYSGSDMTALAKDAAMGPLRALGDALLTTAPDQIRPMNITDFEESMQTIRPSVSPEGLQAFEQWAALYGSSGA